MPSYSSSLPQPQQHKRDLDSLLDCARPFLRGDAEAVDPALPSLLSVLRSVGAGECWHKHGDFLAHLSGVHRALHLWGAPRAIALCGLFHSAYSNSYVNLAIFDPSDASRARVRELVGPAAERLVHLFCVVPRQTMIHDDLLFRYPDEAELTEHLEASERSIKGLHDKGESDPEEAWRRKLNSVIPADGMAVPHIRTGEPVRVSRRVVAAFLLMTMVDFADQLFAWQDELFLNTDGRLEFRGNNPAALWPGSGKPGLWVNSISRMGALYHLIVREEELHIAERGGGPTPPDRDEDLELVIPPVLDGCTRILGYRDQIVARDMYWDAVTGGELGNGPEAAEELLLGCIDRNPFVAEPRIVLAQAYLAVGRYEEAEAAAEVGLRLALEWGSSWDKRVSWEGWVAWGRVLLSNARQKEWPTTGFGVLNLGLVR